MRDDGESLPTVRYSSGSVRATAALLGETAVRLTIKRERRVREGVTETLSTFVYLSDDELQDAAKALVGLADAVALERAAGCSGIRSPRWRYPETSQASASSGLTRVSRFSARTAARSSARAACLRAACFRT